MALADLGGSGDSARVVAQWTYDAYGAVLTADHLHSHDLVRAGHKGLFVDRLDEGVSDGTQDTPRLIPDAHLLVHMRNRSYMPGHGRFLQRDPNATAQVLMDNASWFHGGAAVAVLSAFDLQDHYGDGANLYEYLGSNPRRHWDPLGLKRDPFDIVDDYLAVHAGSVAAFLGQITNDAQATAHIIMQVAQLHPGVAMATAGVNLLSGNGSAWDVAVLATGGTAAGILLGRTALQASRARASYNAGRAGAVQPRSPVWDLPPFERGRRIEQALGHNTPPAFKVVDRWDFGTATSIKSIDLGARTYQNAGRVTSKLRGYTSKLANFREYTRGGLTIRDSDIRRRELLVAIPHAGDRAQRAAISDAKRHAASLGVVLRIVVH